MELTVLLSKVFGIYLIVGGITYIARQKYFMSAVRDFVDHKSLRMIVAFAESIAGLFLVLQHSYWDTLPEKIVSIVGWLMVLEGAFYLLMPDNVVKKTVKVFNKKSWYVVGGIISILAGVYLVNFGFSLNLLN